MEKIQCPHCGANLIEDAWESITEQENGEILVDAYPAFICQRDCGFVEEIPEIIAQQGDDRLLLQYSGEQGRILDIRVSKMWPAINVESILGRGYWEEYTGNHDITTLLQNVYTRKKINVEKPNLFQFATSELSQDAFLCWLFAHLSKNTSSDESAYKVAKQLLKEILAKFKQLHPGFHIGELTSYSLKIEQQVKQIDILLTLESKIDKEKIYVIIEDKTNSGESRKNQPEYYAKKLVATDAEAVIIPAILKTGYVKPEIQAQYAKRKIVFIGHEDIYGIFSTYVREIESDVILQSWWNHFYETYYVPIEQAKSLQVDPNKPLKLFNRLYRENSFPESIIFKKITAYLFADLTDRFTTKLFSVQGKGHVDWHYQIKRKYWQSTTMNIAINIYFIWDTYKFSLVLKTAPFHYKPFKRLSEAEKEAYTQAKKLIQSKLQVDWKMTNYYLQIAQMKGIETIPLGDLKMKIKKEINQIANQIDTILANEQVGKL